MGGALDGVRVIDFGQWIAGPLTAMLLADQGAEVIHVDPPAGPRWRSAANATYNRGKTSLVLSLKEPPDRATARRLIDTADVVVENFRPGVADRLGIGPQAVMPEHSRLIYCSIPGFASDDPRAGMPAWEGVIAASTGTYPSSTDPDGRPRFNALPVASGYGALVAATAIAMALVARERDGLGQRLEVPLFDAMFVAIGASGLLVDGSPAGGRPDDPWGGLFQCRDGRSVRLNLATPRFVGRFVEAADKQDWIADGYLEPDALARGSERRSSQEREMLDLFRSRTASEWEELGHRADLPLTMVRTGAEWLQTSQAREAEIVLPVDDSELGPMLQPGLAVRLSDSPGAVTPRMWSQPAQVAELLWRPLSPARAHGDGLLTSALQDIRVVDISQVLAGPTAGRTLAEFGADVVKVNNPLEQCAGYRWSVHRYHTDVNRGKQTLLLDLKTRDGLDVLWRLLDHADVIIQNFRPGVAERLGVGYDEVRKRKPEMVYGSVGLYGSGGPWEGLPGYEVNAQAVSGMLARTGGIGPPFAVNDYSTGLLAAFGVGLALFYRSRTGKGQHVEAALARTATTLQAPFLQSYQGKHWDEPAGPLALGWSPLQRLYRAADGWFFVGAGENANRALSSINGLEGLEGLSARELVLALEQRLRMKPVAEWVNLLCLAGIGSQRVRRPLDLMQDRWVVAHGLSITRDHNGTRVTTVGPPARLSRTPVIPGRPVSSPGGDAGEILAGIGMADHLEQLVRDRVIAPD